MSWDSPDRPLPSHSPLDEERIRRVTEAVMAGLEVRRRPPGILDLISGLIAWNALPRFAMPMGAAALMGVMLSRHLHDMESGRRLAEFVTLTTLPGAMF